MHEFSDWQYILVWSSVVSVGVVLACLIAIPWVVGRLPVDYFSRSRRRGLGTSPDATLFSRVIDAVKNVLGLAFVILGAIMLVTPGQGVLTILVGLLLMNFPGKYKLERWLVMQSGVMRGLNWLRTRRGRAPFEPITVKGTAQGSKDSDADLPDA